MIRVSVAMCTYNGEKFLPEQLASIAAQTRLPDEMVVCDDGSTDSTTEIVEEFARTISFPMRFIRNPENLGSTKNFEKAIGLCAGDLIALCDQDDIWMPDKLARQAEMMERDPELGGVFSDAELVDDHSHLVGERLWTSALFTSSDRQLFRAGRGAAVLTRKPVVTGATLMVRSSLRPLFLPIGTPWVHDGWIAWMLVAYSKIDFIEDPLIRYRIHSGQQIGLEVVALPRTLTLMERFEKSKCEGLAKLSKDIRELQELVQHLARSPDIKSQAALPGLRQKIRFLEDRRGSYTGGLSNMRRILRNARSYHRYGNGWRSLLRDIAINFL
jgi:glycosyltransferase involved in cell wall biosynthesis